MKLEAADKFFYKLREVTSMPIVSSLVKHDAIPSFKASRKAVQDVN